MKSKRFRPSVMTKWLVPFLMALLLGTLLLAFVIVALSVFGFKINF